MRNHVAAFSLSLVVLVYLALLVGCDKQDPVAAEVTVLRKATTPPGSIVLQYRELARKGYTASASWEFEIDWAWPKYTEWVTNRLAPIYLVVHVDADRLDLRRSLEGDVFLLSIKRADKVLSRRFLASFTASPD